MVTRATVPAKTAAKAPGKARPALPAELKRRIAAELPGWQVLKGELVARWTFSDFVSALGAVVRVGALAEQAGHHPDLELGWGYLGVRLQSHDAGTVTERDLALGLRIHKALGRPS